MKGLSPMRLCIHHPSHSRGLSLCTPLLSRSRSYKRSRAVNSWLSPLPSEPCCRIAGIRARQCERVFQDSQSLTRWRSHTAHKDIRKDFRWEGREAAALWLVLQLGNGDSREARRSRNQTDPADPSVKNEADFVEAGGDLGPRASLAYEVFET